MSVLSAIKNKIRLAYHNHAFAVMSRLLAGEENAYTLNHAAPDLSFDELAQIKQLWRGVLPDVGVGLSGFKSYKKHFPFTPEYVPFSYFFPWMVRILNPIDAARVFANKSLTYTYFSDVAQPRLIARLVNGCLLDSENRAITDDELVDLMTRAESNAIIKASLGSCCGKAVQVIHPGESREAIAELLRSYKGDFVIQDVLRQSSCTAKFNASSLNTFRISTLLLNGKFSVCTAMLRFGLPGSVVDNVGAGGGCVGVNDDGSLMPFGFNKAGDKIAEWNGIRFEGCTIPDFKSVIDAAKKAHYDIPLCAFVGWDLAIDDKGVVNLIEANLEWPGLFFEQLANGRPAFRERFEEVMSYVREHPLPLSSMYNATN